MRFAASQVLWLLLTLLPALGVFLVWTWRQKQKLIAQFVQSRLLANLTIGVSQTRQKLRLLLVFLAVGFVLMALARPQWGFDWQEVHQRGLDIIVAIDTSRSMLASDAKPNRLEAAKRAAFDLIKFAKSDRLGLVAFAGGAFLQCPLTIDETAFRQSIDSLNVGIIPQGGTALGEAIQTARDAFEKGGDNHKVLVLFTDGEDHESGAVAVAEKAAAAGLKIFTIGVGTGDGELIRLADASGQGSFLKDENGNVVKSRLNETLLQQIATAANGFYLPLRGARPVETLYERGLAPLPKSDSSTKLVRMYHERFYWPLSMAIGLLILEMFLPHRRRVRRTAAIATAANPDLRKAVAGLVFLLLPLSLALGASPGSAFRDYEEGRYQDAFSKYEKLAQKNTNDARLYFNAGDAAYRSKKFDQAQKYFTQGVLSPDLPLQEQSFYNLANTLFQMGDPETDLEKKQKTWEQSVQNYANALKLDSRDGDARNNLEFVKGKLEELKKQKEQQQQQDKGKQPPQPKNQKDDPQKQNQKDKPQNKTPEEKDPEGNQKGKSQDENKPDSNDSQAKNDKPPGKSQGSEPDGKPDDQRSPEPAEATVAGGEMTREQAQQFLEAQKQNEKALIFAPAKKNRPPGKFFKDW